MTLDKPMTYGQVMIALSDMRGQYQRLVEELKRADHVIEVLYAHLKRPPAKSIADMMDLATDLANRGLRDNRETRTKLLQEVTA